MSGKKYDWDILHQPLVMIGGGLYPKLTKTVYMHKGYDRPLIKIEKILSYHNEIGVYIWGDLDNPLFFWPIYVEIRKTNLI